MEHDSPSVESKTIARLRQLFMAYGIVSTFVGVPLLLAGAFWLFVFPENLLPGMGLFVGGLYAVVVVWGMVQSSSRLAARDPDGPRMARVSLVAALPGAVALSTGGVVAAWSGFQIASDAPVGFVPLLIGLVAIVVSVGVLGMVVDMLRSDDLDQLMWSEIEPDADELMAFEFDGEESGEAIASVRSSKARGL